MKIVILDGYTENPGDLTWEPLEKLGQVTVYDRISYEESPEIAEKIGDAEIVVTNKTPVSRETMDRCPGIRLIAVMATAAMATVGPAVTAAMATETIPADKEVTADAYA